MSRPKGARNKALPQGARQLLIEAREYLTPLVEAIIEAEGAGVECTDAKDWVQVCHKGINARAAKYFPDLVIPE